jgi:hypothetical protein
MRNIFIVSEFWLLCIKLLWTFLHTFLCRYGFWFLYGKCIRIQLLCHVFSFEKLSNCFQSDRHFAFPLAMYEWYGITKSSPSFGVVTIFFCFSHSHGCVLGSFIFIMLISIYCVPAFQLEHECFSHKLLNECIFYI